MRELGLLQAWQHHQPLNRGHSGICAAGAATGVNSLFLTSCPHYFEFLYPYCAVHQQCEENGSIKIPKFT